MPSKIRKILLVDDEPGMLEPMVEYLSFELKQFEILSAANGHEALKIIDEEEIDLVVSDIKMPKISGLQLLSHIQRDYPHICVILMSAYRTDQIQEEVERNDYLHFIQKPFSMADLKKIIVEQMRKADEGFQGTLKNIQLNDIIQMCCLSIISMAIRVQKGTQSGIIYIKNGEIIHATCGDIVGEEAYYRIVSWESGRFETLGDIPAPEVSINRDWQFLLMEAARLSDENQRQREESQERHIRHKADHTFPRLRVLIVDDSAMMCKILTHILNEDKAIEVVGTAQNGQEALGKISELKPDLITLDVNMPVMDGSTALKHIMIKTPCPVVIISNINQKSQMTILDFLSLGAVDFLSKPVRSKNMSVQHQRMIRQIRKAGAARVANFRRGRVPRPRPMKQCGKLAINGRTFGLSDASVLVIMSSGVGGYAELIKVIPTLPNDCNAAFIALQSMQMDFIEPLSDYLDIRSLTHVRPLRKETASRVPLAEHAFQWNLHTGNCYIGVPNVDLQMIISDSNYCLYTTNNGTGPTLNPPKDDGDKHDRFDSFLFSIAETYTGDIIVILLSGAEIGSMQGLKRIKEKNGRIIAQQLDTCVVSDSLKEAIQADLVDQQISPDQIAKQIFNMINQIDGT